MEDNSGSKIIVFAVSGNLYIPACTDINTTYVLTNNFTNCYEDIPVSSIFAVT
jgi:hypothetical protein